MKTLTEYINESILDVDDLIANNDKFINDWIRNNCSVISPYTIKNGIVDVNGGVVVNNNVESIDIKFGRVKGQFNLSMSPFLTSLEGCPDYVGGDFVCDWNKRLTSLKGAPKEVGGSFNCDWCRGLTTLEGSPEKVGTNFSCNNCKSLTSLKGAPKEVGRDFECRGCDQLKNYRHKPKTIKGKFYKD